MAQQTNELIRKYYDDLYKSDDVGNIASATYNRLRVEMISDWLPKEKQRLLIVGCGNKADQILLTQNDSAIGFDISHNAVAGVEFKEKLFVGDVLTIPLADSSVVNLVCSEVLEHIPLIENAAKEIARVVKPGGVVIVSTPNWNSWFGLFRWIGEKVFHRELTSDGQPYDDWKTYNKLVKQIGCSFKIQKVYGVWYLPPMHFRGKGLPDSLTKIIIKLSLPINRMLSKVIPKCGHLIILKLIRLPGSISNPINYSNNRED